ncbi:hypothetical protein B484DRAFT_424379 [Ochromonadaceae sp. CCMP2298]|nr:hypothetical protein B484DRAFT_424379 [Ochromonadaceae sp. CCMP2298]
MASDLRLKARSLFNAGLTLLQQVSQKNDSSDEETEVEENEEYINNGARGVIVFQAISARTERPKVLHVNLYSQRVVQYYDAGKRTFQCEDIQSVSRNAEKHVLLEVRRGMTLQAHVKRIVFDTERTAHLFHQYIEFINESGRSVKAAFNQIDYRRSGLVSASDLRRALVRVDLHATDEEIAAMLSLGTAGSFDFHDFLHLLLNSFVSSLRQCLPGEVVAYAPSEKVHWCVFGGRACKYPLFFPGMFYY